MAAVAVWPHRPSPQELLKARLDAGWRPTPSYVVGGPRVLGLAQDVPPERWTKPGEATCKVLYPEWEE